MLPPHRHHPRCHPRHHPRPQHPHSPRRGEL